jgi:predicted Zn-dependent protease
VGIAALPAVTSAKSREALSLLVENAFEAAQLSSPDPWFRFPIWKNVKSERPAPTPVAYDSQYGALPIGWDLFEETYEHSHVETLLRRKTEKIVLGHAKEIHGLKYRLLSRGDGDLTIVDDERCFARPLHERDEWLQVLARQAARLRKAVPLRVNWTKAGVVFAPGAANVILRRLIPGFHADVLQNGDPFFPVEVGQPMFSEAITIADHGQLAEAPHSAPFDMEGSITQETVLVDRGVLKDLLYDTYAATRENRLSTGNFSRSGNRTHPRIGASNFYLRPSNATPAQLLQALGTGLVLEVIESIEPVAAEENAYVVYGRGWRVSEGRCVEPVRGIALKFDIFTLFQRAAAVGSDLRFFGPVGSPSIFFEEIPLSSM